MRVTDELRGVHVLLVEDSDDTREILEAALVYCGASLSTTASAKAAMQVLRERSPDVIVSDIAMPDDGVALVREVMEFAKAQGIEIPVIAISAHHFEPAELKRVGFVDFVPKPLDPIALCGQIRAHVRAR